MGLRNVKYIGESTVSDNLEANIISFFNWGFLNTCAFGNILLGTSGNYGAVSASTLRRASNSAYTDGQVWEGFRKQWVWQSGTECPTQPINISGVYVNNAFKPASGVGPFSFNIDYPNGRIIFNSPISTSSKVKVEHSYNYIQLYNSDCPWWKDVQRNSYRIDDTFFSNTTEGIWAESPDRRIQLPAIIFQSTPIIEKEPYEIGNHSHYHRQQIRCYVITETNRDLKWISDVIAGQYEQMIGAFDANELYTSGVYPINMDTGSLNSATMNYPDLVNKYSWNRPIRFLKLTGWIPEGLSNTSSVPIFSAVLQLTLETYLN